MKTIKINNVEITETEFQALAVANGYTKAKAKSSVKPENGSHYYYISVCGDVRNTLWKGDQWDNEILAMGGVFLTSQDTQEAIDRQLAKVRVLNRLVELSEGFVDVDWSDGGQRKHSMMFDAQSKTFALNHSSSLQSQDCEYYTTNNQAWKTIVEEMPDDIKLMMGINNYE